jgi:tetratricopeptide (TPR) repeat protein
MIDKALEINPDYKEASYSKAYTYYNQKKYDQSIAVLRPLLEANPDYYDATLLLGDCYYLQKNYDEAILLYENAYTNGGSRSRVLCHIMAYIYDTKGDYEKAINLYKEALSYDSSVVDIYKRLGELIPNADGNIYRSRGALLQQR